MKNKIANFWNKCKWWLLGIIFLYPFYLLPLGKIWCIDELYTFGLPLKDFMPVWIALGGIIGVVTNIILTQQRMTEQQRQFKTQIKKQNKQIKIQQKQMRDNRFASGVKLLGNSNESTRIGGAYNLYFLARDFEEYRESACEILCAHVRTKTGEEDYPEKYKDKPSNEIQTIINLLFKEEYKLIFKECEKNLKGTFLNGVSFFRAKLNRARFNHATFCDVDFRFAKLSYVDFNWATLIDVDFESFAELSNVNFWVATLDKVNFRSTIFNVVDFWDTTFQTEIDFTGTKLEGLTTDEIKCRGFSRKLTGNQENYK